MRDRVNFRFEDWVQEPLRPVPDADLVRSRENPVFANYTWLLDPRWVAQIHFTSTFVHSVTYLQVGDLQWLLRRESLPKEQFLHLARAKQRAVGSLGHLSVVALDLILFYNARTTPEVYVYIETRELPRGVAEVLRGCGITPPER
jgi:hypothetical protein